MERFCPSPPLPCGTRVWLVAFLLAGYLGAPIAHAQKSGAPKKPILTPGTTPRPLTADTIGVPSDGSDTLPDPVARVDGQPINRDDLQKVTEALLASNGRSLQKLTPTERKEAYVSVLSQIIDDRLISAQAKDETVDDLKVEQTYANLQKQYPDGAFDDQIKKSGQTPDKIRANIRGQIAQQQWLEKQIGTDAKVTPQEVEKFYKDAPPGQFDVPEMVQASHILVAVRRDAPPEDVLAAENRINAINARLKKGEKFDAVARTDSDDPNSKNAGGDLGPFTRERVLPEIGDAAFKLKVGEVSPPVRSPFGFHLILLTDRKASHTATLGDASKSIEGFLIQQKRSAAAAKVVQRLRDNAKIENFLS